MRRFEFVGPWLVFLLSACSADIGEFVGNDRSSLTDAGAVLGFENAANWRASSGQESTSADHTEGSHSLALAEFTTTELHSIPLSTLTGLATKLAFDFKPPITLTEGHVQLYVSIPSQDVYDVAVGEGALAGLPMDSWSSIAFDLPNTVLAALGRSYSDLGFKIALSVPWSAEPYLFDNLHFVATPPAHGMMVDIANVDDFVYVTVNDHYRKVVPLGSSLIGFDLTDAVPGPRNGLRIQAINTGGPASHSIRVWLNGRVQFENNCPNAPCTPDTSEGEGIVYDLSARADTGTELVMLRVQGPANAAVYLNHSYTGTVGSRTSFKIPPGRHTIGLGIDGGSPEASTGHYYEQTISVERGSVSVAPQESAPLAFPNRTRIAVLPIRQTLHGEGGPANTGVLSASDIATLYGQAQATRAAWVEPFSYGLTTWDVELLPALEDVPLHRGAGADTVPDIGQLLADANLYTLEERYDMVVYFFSSFTDSGAPVSDAPCCFWGGGKRILFPNHTTRNGQPADAPNLYLFHEVLHGYELHNSSRLGFYPGAGGVHGASAHGYYPGDGGEPDLLAYYRNFLRNQVAEMKRMRAGVDYTGSRPSFSDLWVGVFDTMRHDVDWQTPRVAPSQPPPALCALPAPEP